MKEQVKAQNSRVLIGVTGGIAAYKALDVISALRKKNVDVKVIMTENASEFISPLTFQSISQNPVAVGMFEKIQHYEIEHISLAHWADVIAVIPATANIIGKVASGIADDLLSTTIMAASCEVVFAPAMNTYMFNNPIVQDNIEKLKKYNYSFIMPQSGRLACGDTGIGKLENVDVITEAILSKLNKNKDLKGCNVMVTAGPTISPIDPVRFISNHSSGKMGYAIAEEARDRGANVTLVSGPTNLRPLYGVEMINVNTNEEMMNAVLQKYDSTDIVVKAAAVADYKVKEYSSEKIKKADSDLNLEFERDNDILSILGKKKKNQILVGFAAESNNLIENSENKIKKKNLDFIVANDITKKDTGFKSEDNKVTIIDKEGNEYSLEKMSKRNVAKKIFDLVKRR